MEERESLDERLPALFEPDTLLPVQYYEAMRKKHLLEGEKRLILSVLEDAIDCFMKCITSPTNKGQRLFREAEEWINLEDKKWVVSFDNVCEMLDINPDYMRRGLRQWKERKLDALARQALAAATQIDQPKPLPEAPARVVTRPEPNAKPHPNHNGNGHGKLYSIARRARRKTKKVVASRRVRTSRVRRKARA